MNTIEAMQKRHSVRHFLDKEVNQQDLMTLLEAARHSPSGSNTQPWQVAVVRGKAKQRLADAMVSAFEQGETTAPAYQYYPNPMPSPYNDRRKACGLKLYQTLNIARDDKAGQRAQWAANYRSFDAPVMLFFWMDGIMQTGSYMDMGMFMQSVMLAAVDCGLATCPQAALAQYPNVVKEHLSIPKDAIILSGMALGYEDTEAQVNQFRTERETVENFIQFYDE
ncbi:MAG TPA: nitroreductase [Methylophaga aminisulfidivorans]|uniref:nitroreductase n=1 Tax=Methylophaga TaxID=40222 RepID=UPI001751073C|nr:MULTISPECIES: nitroreductase [Methylophaga]HIC46456.1 nitroreductase [Methylophaga sp.]HIM38581.1 nitroreductase [Methylophaga aminisulfidivorans]